MRKGKPELLAPAGNLEKLKIAVAYGADAVYLGGEDYSLRVRADNFTIDELQEGIVFAHENGVKAYITVNAFFRNKEIKNCIPYLRQVADCAPDGIVVSDPGVILLLQEIAPTIPIHLSTQANTTNLKACEFWKKQGIARIVLARELSGEEITDIRKNTAIELEIFIHGALCISYSGRCWISKYLTDRDANTGDCSQPCRWHYQLQEEKRPDEYFPVEEDKRGTYFFNSKDLCLINCIPEIVKSGVHSVKIEGRMKSISYLATTLAIYRQAIDRYCDNPDLYTVDPAWEKELRKVSSRDYTTGFFIKTPSSQQQNIARSSYIKGYTFIGIIRSTISSHSTRVDIRNKITLGEQVELFDRRAKLSQNTVQAISDLDGTAKEVAQPNDIVIMEFTNPVNEYSILRKKKQ